MKLSIILLFAAVFQVSAHGFGQTIRVVEKDAPLEKIFRSIRKQTGYTFAYTESMLRQARRVSVNIPEGSLEEVLKACFVDQPFNYTIIDQTIVIKPKEEPLTPVAAVDTVPSPIQITGQVVDSAGNPLVNASVTVKGMRGGTTTGTDGNFSIVVKNSKSVLSISMIGYGTRNITLGAERSLHITLLPVARDLNDVVITGYQNKARRFSAGSSANVRIQTLTVQPVASFDQLLQGQAAGVDVKTGSGQPGRPSNVVIRGKGSINGSTDPLYIIDGVQLEANDFASINPEDFESVTILKDGASTSLYGSRGANGVIVITTRKGREGKMVVTYNNQFGFSELPPSKLKVMNSQQHVDFEMNVAGNPYGWTADQADSLKKINFDWQDALFKRAPIQEHQLSISGGNSNTKYFSSMSYLDESGILIHTGIRRYTGRFNIEHTEGHFRFGTNIAGGWSKSRAENEGGQGTTNPLNNFLWALPYEKPYTPDGKYAVSIQGPAIWTNPVEDINENLGHSYNTKAFGNGFLEFNVPWVSGLTLRTNLGGDYGQDEYFDIVNNGTQSAIQNGSNSGPQYAQGDLRQGFTKQFRYTITNSVQYHHLLGAGEDHNLSIGLYHETVRTQASGFGYTAFGLLNPFRNAAGLVAGTATNGYIPLIDNVVYTPDNGIVSFFGIADYTYKNKFIAGASLRRDGTSRLSKENRWVNYGGVSGAYIISEENFLKNNKTINLLKVKASYGTVGNQDGIGDFPYLQAYSSGTFAGGSSLNLTTFGNADLKWETRSTFNTGVEISLFDRRVTTELEFYNSLTHNLFFNLTTPSTSGGPGFVLGNAGSMRNRGFEASVNLAVIRQKDFEWSVDANYSLNRNVILSLPQGQTFQLYKDFQVLQVGKPLNSFYLDRFVGVDPQTGSSVYLKKDGKTRTNDYDPDDRVTLSTSDAPFHGGITNNLRYKNIRLSFTWVYSYGNSVYNYARTNIEYPGYVTAGFSANAIHAWTTPGQITNFPALSDPFQYNTTRYLENDKFWRLRNAMISYSLPQELCNRLKIQSLRIFAQGQNLLAIFKFQAFDPEFSTLNSSTSNSNGDITGAQYPPLRTISFGASISF
ncbi:MAG TPA: SusC/RagA family TonB-linked outer membrane protein [Puia sp.]|nr:SusC/RagA family TonB-linked outer membrane protein [Puia sp.]